jgi:hypothetical protein
MATVHDVAEGNITIEYLDGSREDVGREKVRSFQAFLHDRKKVLSQTREDLCRVLYGRAFDRLSAARVEEMQRFFRANGLRYKPESWPPEARIQISLDSSFVAADRPEVDADLHALLPRWLEPNRLPPGSRDPLGLQNHAERLANEILPGLTVFTSRIGYYGFIAWAVKQLNEEILRERAFRRDYFHRLERTLALCEFVHHGQEDRSCSILGQRSKTQILQSAVKDRFRVPSRILRNQESAGALRLYSTSLASMGFAVQAPELAADGFLPLQLTDLGKELAEQFGKRVPHGFWNFALSDATKDRDLLRDWGRKLCFSNLGKSAYRGIFLKGFLLGGSKDAERRHQTVRLLFKRGLLRGVYDVSKPRKLREDSIAEDDIAGLEEDADENGLANRDVLFRFYGEKPKAENALLQKASVFELLSLAQAAIFAHATNAIESAGRASVAGLAEVIVAEKEYGSLWKDPLPAMANKAGSVREIERALLETEDLAAAAALGGALMARVQSENAYRAISADLADTPVTSLLGAIDPSVSLAQAYPNLLQAMVSRHEQVSRNKNRQRWCYLDSGSLRKDELQPFGVGWHSMRFPQLWSLCRDLGLTQQDV